MAELCRIQSFQGLEVPPGFPEDLNYINNIILKNSLQHTYSYLFTVCVLLFYRYIVTRFPDLSSEYITGTLLLRAVTFCLWHWKSDS